MRTQNVQLLLLNTLPKPFFHLVVSCWQTSAANYPSTSAEFKSRDRFNFIRTKGETWQIQIPITIYDRTSEQPFYCYYADTY